MQLRNSVKTRMGKDKQGWDHILGQQYWCTNKQSLTHGLKLLRPLAYLC
jgi:hypothetical protein